MRVLFINTFDKGGGAAVVSLRLGTFLSTRYGIEAVRLVGNQREASKSVYRSRNKFQGLIERVLDRVTRLLGAQYLFFPFSTNNILKAVKEIKPDVISLHNIHGGYFQTSLLKRISGYAPVVWTLHDMWSFTGNAAHTFGDESWKWMKNSSSLTRVYPSIGVNTGAWLLRHKRKIYAQSNVTVICPSKWLANLAAQSPLFKEKPIHHINNGVDLDVFYQKDKSLVREKLGIALSMKVVMFSAEHLNDGQWKGGSELLDMLRAIDNNIDFPCVLLIVGSGKLIGDQDYKNLNVHYTGFINSEESMVDCYCAADLFLYPTKADNLPNVLVEAIACGLPCITFDVGGCKEIIIDGWNGFIIERGSTKSVTALLRDEAALQTMSKNARRYAEDHFSLRKMCDDYYTIFKSIS